MVTRAPPSWDIFCKVIDNYGDIGVCWRLCQQLAMRGQSVRLIVDDASALTWMTPLAVRTELVEVIDWEQSHQIEHPADIVIESFGCALAESYIFKMSLKANIGAPSHWINLEYLSAEPYAERNHLLPSPVMSGAGKGLTKIFFYPGFTAKTGGLLREPDVLDRQATFDKTAWLKAQGIHWITSERIISLFCYEPKALPHLLAELRASPEPTLLLVTAGRANDAIQQIVRQQETVRTELVEVQPEDHLRIHYLPYLSQIDYDHLLWASDFNFVRGEDSLVRAIWAGKPFVWHIYPQDDDAHHAKLQAFLDLYLAHADAETAAHIRQAHEIWNNIRANPLTNRLDIHLDTHLHAWQALNQARCGTWAGLPSLVDALMSSMTIDKPRKRNSIE